MHVPVPWAPCLGLYLPADALIASLFYTIVSAALFSREGVHYVVEKVWDTSEPSCYPISITDAK